MYLLLQLVVAFDHGRVVNFGPMHMAPNVTTSRIDLTVSGASQVVTQLMVSCHHVIMSLLVFQFQG